MSADEDLPEVTAWIIYRWDCPECQDENELGQGMSPGDTEECDGCGAEVKVGDAL